jgi:hypothetical protein
MNWPYRKNPEIKRDHLINIHGQFGILTYKLPVKNS